MTRPQRAAFRVEIDEDLKTLHKKWEALGMPILGSMARVIRYAYTHELEGQLESLMDTWLWSAEKQIYRQFGRRPPAMADDDAPRTPATIARHADKMRAMDPPKKKTSVIKKRRLPRAPRSG